MLVRAMSYKLKLLSCIDTYDNAGTRNTGALITSVVVVVILLGIITIVIIMIITVVILLQRQRKSIMDRSGDQCMEEKSALTPMYLPVDDKRFQKISVTQDCELREFVEKNNKLPFTRGCAFYEFTHEMELILDHKEVVLLDEVS